MVLGIIGLVFGWLCGGFPLSLLAIILGHVAFAKITRDPQRLTGKGMAIAGFTTGYVGLAITLVAMLVFGVVATAFAALLQGFGEALKAPPR
jgi:hypothetical protein